MPGRKTIREAIFAGTKSANVKYEELSNGWWLTDSGVESLLVSAIAESLGSKQSDGESLVMELPFRNIVDWSGTSRRRGRPRATLRGINRADIVLFNRDRKPVCVIEVKRLWDRARCFGDLARIRDLVLQCNRQHDGSLRRGFLALMLAKKATANETAKQRIGTTGGTDRRPDRSRVQQQGIDAAVLYGTGERLPGGISNPVRRSAIGPMPASASSCRAATPGPADRRQPSPGGDLRHLAAAVVAGAHRSVPRLLAGAPAGLDAFDQTRRGWGGRRRRSTAARSRRRRAGWRRGGGWTATGRWSRSSLDRRY